jgi:nicotinate-nucleotide adenylyltransferase
MVESAIAGYEEFLVSRCEIDRQEPSYTVETLRYFKKVFALVESEFFLLMGADMFNDLPNWRDAGEICRLATPLVVRRPDTPLPYFEALSGLVSFEHLEKIRSAAVQMPPIGLSSTQIRSAVAEGKSIRFQVPRNVEVYIVTHQLYGMLPMC